MNDSSSSGSDLGVKIGISVVLAVVVVALAAFTANVLVGVVAAVATVIAFFVIDSLSGPAAPTPAAGGGSLPLTSTESLPPVRGVEPPSIAEPEAPSNDVAASTKQGARLDPALFDTRSVEIKKSAEQARRVFSIRVAKHGNSIGECEDAVEVDPRRSVLAVADGASSSFGANIWAETLTKQFVKTPPKPLSVSSFHSWLEAARSASPESKPPGGEGDANGWWSEQGARQGAYSTVIGAAIMADGANQVATVMCLGDSCAFVLTGEAGSRSVRRALPYDDAEQFGSHPALLGSASDRPHDEPTWTTIPIDAGDLLVLASDAVSEWLLGDPQRFNLFDGHEPDAIAQRIIEERTNGLIVNDDMTLAVIEPES
mgnify:CR=1 FL=1